MVFLFVDFEQVNADWVSKFPFKIKRKTVYHGFLISLQIYRGCNMSQMFLCDSFENFRISYFASQLCIIASVMSKKFDYVIYKFLLESTWSLNRYFRVKTNAKKFKLIRFSHNFSMRWGWCSFELIRSI